jgi:hypothetical protein
MPMNVFIEDQKADTIAWRVGAARAYGVAAFAQTAAKARTE